MLNKKLIVGASAGIVGFIALVASMENVASGEFVRIQSPSGEYTWHTDAGLKMKIPFLSTTTTYNEITTIAISDEEEVREAASAVMPPMLVQFADTYGGYIEGTFRVQLPSDPERLELMHRAVKNQRNLEGNTLITFAKDILSQTTDQFLAANFMQGGKGAFKQRLVDQAQNGMLVTKRVKKRVVGETADQSLNKASSEAKSAVQYQWVVEVQTDENGKALRRDHNLAQYGIYVSQVSLGDFKAEPDLKAFVETKKKRERERADVVAQQNLERDKAVTEQLRGDRERIQAKNQSLMEKDRAVIQGEKQVEIAVIQAEREVVEREKLATLAKIDKQKELEVSKANEAIQKANAAAARYEAQALKEVGLAKAAVKKADYAAIDKEILISNNNKVVAIAMYSSGIVIDMPEYVNIGGDNTTTTPLESMSTIKLMEQLKVNTSKQKNK